MAVQKIPHKGDDCPFTPETSGEVVPSPETPTPKPGQSFTPRGQRFSKLSDAYFNITSRQASGKATTQASNESQSSPVAHPRFVKSQDDLGITDSASALPNSLKKYRRASSGAIDFFEGLSATMRNNNTGRLSLDQQSDSNSSDIKSQPQDTTNGTIEGILAQYDAPTSSPDTEHKITQKYWENTEFTISQPPRDVLPEPPFATTRSTCDALHSEHNHESSVSDSSITDSQHLLDAEAQICELGKARRALVPPPLNVRQPSSGERAFHVPYQQPRIELGVNENSMPVSDDVVRSSSHALYSSDADKISPLQQEKPEGTMISQPSLVGIGKTQKPFRNIKVVIGRESETGGKSQECRGTLDDAERWHHDGHSEDGDWVTEATSDAGLGLSVGARGQPRSGAFNRAGSSIADYSDEGNGDTEDRFGSCERIIQPSGDNLSRKPNDAQRLSGSKLTCFFSLRHNVYSENASRRWESTTQKWPSQFRPQILCRSTDRYRELRSNRPETPRRLVFDFDRNAPPRYEFRDSTSEYEPATASVEATCGTDTHGSLPSLPPGPGEDNHRSTADGHFDMPANFNSNDNPPSDGPRPGTKLSIYAADRQKQLELEKQQFAAASSCHTPKLSSSVASKFEFELLPLNLAQKKNKLQRDTGETNETESAVARIKRKRGSSSFEFSSSPVEAPSQAFLTSRDLSIDFLPSGWQEHTASTEDTSTPFSRDRFNQPASRRNLSRNRNSWLGAPETPLPLGARPCGNSLRYDQENHRIASSRDRYTNRLRPSLIVPENYVSDRADRIRQRCFHVIVVLSILPFFGVLALTGVCNDALKWATQGEVDQLTARQRRVIKLMLQIEFIIYTGGAVAIIVYFVERSKAGH